MEKRNVGLGQQANHFSPCVLLPSSAALPHPSETVTPMSLCPSARVCPDGRVGGGKAGDARAQQQEPRASLALRLLCLSGLCSRLTRAPAQPIAMCASGLCSRLPRAPAQPITVCVWSGLQAARAPAQPIAVCARIKHRMVFLWLSQPQLLAASLSLTSCPSALASLPHTPAPAEAASGLPSELCSVLPTARSLSECPG